MELNEALTTRRSVRAYDADRRVSVEQIKELVSAGILAPSWKNSQTARIYAVISDEMRERFAAECLPEFNAKNSAGAAFMVMTFIENRSGFQRDGTPDNECGNGWGYYDLGLHTENILLKAQEMGLSTLVMGIRDGAAIRGLLAVPENEIIVSVLAVGYASGENPPMPKRKTAEDILKVY